MKRKVRIKSLPQGYHMMPDGTVMKDSAHMAEGGTVNKNLSPVPRGMANLEAEKGEVAMTDLGNTGMMGLYAIGGERHSNGGTPLNLDPGSFIYSDTRKMKIKDPEFLAKYGKTKPTTPAKLVKPFLAINDFTNTLYDQNADSIQKRTAQSMIDKYQDKAGEIAFYQEAMKGFPQGVPAVAQDYAEGIMGAPMMAYGGYIPKAQQGTSVQDKKQRFVAQYGPTAQKVGAQFGIDPAIILAQAALESGWGTSSLFKRSNNLFGIMAAGKPNQYWEGDKTKGQAGNFRVYPSVENSMADFARLIRDKKEYAPAYKVANDPEAYARAIAQSPYIAESNGDNRASYERILKNNATEIQRLLPTAISVSPASAPSSAPTRSYVDPQVFDRFLSVNREAVANRRDDNETRFFTPSRQLPSAPQLRMPFDPVNNPTGINYAVQSADEVPGIIPYEGGRTEAGRVTPTGVQNRFERSLPEYLASWQEFIPGINNMSNEQAQSAVYDYLVKNEPDAVRNMWGTYGLTAKGKRDKGLASKYKTGKIDPKELTEEDLKNLKSAYTDGLFGVRQMDPVNYGFSATPANVPVRDIGFDVTPKPFEIPRTPVIPEGTKKDPETEPPVQPTPDTGFQPWLQDLNNLRTARRNMLSENRYFGYAPRLPYRPMDAVYLDDTRQQQQIAGRARGTMEALGAFAGPGRQGSMASVISGQAGEQAANVASQMGNANINIANTVGQYNARMMAGTDAANAELAMDLYDKNVTTQEVFDEKMRRYRNLNTALKNNMLTNAYRTKAMNKMNPLFQVVPGVGGDIVFNPGVSAATFNVDDYTSQAERINNAYRSEIENIKSMGLSPEEQSKQLAKLQELRMQSLFGASAKSKGAAYDPSSTYFTWPGNPYGTGVGGQ